MIDEKTLEEMANKFAKVECESGEDFFDSYAHAGFIAGFKATQKLSSERIAALFEKIKHGDQSHQDWLENAINEHFGLAAKLAEKTKDEG